MKLLDESEIKIVEIDLTTMCNADCPLCMRQSQKFKDNYQHPFYRGADEILKQISSFQNLEWVYLIGQMSEPTTHPDFLKITESLKKLGLKLKICTNGSLHKDNFWKSLGHILTDGDSVWFGICGSTNKLHSKYRKNTDLDKILSNAAALRYVRRVDGAKCIRFRYNEDDFESERFKKMISEFSLVEYTDTCIQNDNMDTKNEFSPPKYTLDRYKKIEKLSMLFNKTHPGNECQSIMEKYVQIDPFGNIFPCYRFLEHSKCGWNRDYDDVLNGKFDFCRFCNSKTVEYTEKIGANSVL